MIRIIFLCVAILCPPRPSAVILSQSQTASAVETKKGKIASIKVKGLRSYPEAKVVALTGLHVGDLVSRENLQAAADHLLQIGLFSTVAYSFKSRGEDLDLTFELAEAPAVAVSFDNIPWYSDAELIEAIEKSVPLFSGRAPQEGVMLDEIAAAIQKHLAQRGLSVTVAHELVNNPVNDEMVQLFRVEGAGLRVEHVELGDAVAAESRSVAAQLSTLVGKPYSRSAINLFVSEQVRPIYLERGQVRVRFGTPEVRFTGSPAKPAETVRVIVPIQPGPAFRWNGARWLGNRALPVSVLDSLLALKPNEIANGNKINTALARVEDEYGRRGYLDVKLTPKAEFDDAKALVRYDITVLSEGPQYHMGELVITGLSVVAERRLRAAWPIAASAIFDRTQYEALLAKLQKPNPEIFGEIPLHYDEAGHWLRTDASRGVVDVLLDFK